MLILMLINHPMWKMVESWEKDKICTSTCEHLLKAEVDLDFMVPKGHIKEGGGRSLLGSEWKKTYSRNGLQLKIPYFCKFYENIWPYDYISRAVPWSWKGLMQVRGPETKASPVLWAMCFWMGIKEEDGTNVALGYYGWVTVSMMTGIKEHG